MHAAEQSEDVKYCQIAVEKAVDVYLINNLSHESILMRFSAQQRLRKALDFKEVREAGLRINCGCFIAILKRNAVGIRRFGVVASRKTGNAVRRNRAKRVFREIFRLNQQLLPPSIDLVIIVRSNFVDFSFQDLSARFIKLCQTYN